MNTEDRAPFFTRMREAAQDTLGRDLEVIDAAELAGVNERTWLRYEHGQKMPTPSIIRHFWTQVHLERLESRGKHFDTDVAHFFDLVERSTHRWLPARYRKEG